MICIIRQHMPTTTNKSSIIPYSRMVERINEADYVTVFKGNPGACWSYVGRQGGVQQLSLGEG